MSVGMNRFKVGEQWLVYYSATPKRLVAFTVVAKVRMIFADHVITVMVNNASGAALSFGPDGREYGWDRPPVIPHMVIAKKSRAKTPAFSPET